MCAGSDPLRNNVRDRNYHSALITLAPNARDALSGNNGARRCFFELKRKGPGLRPGAIGSDDESRHTVSGSKYAICFKSQTK